MVEPLGPTSIFYYLILPLIIGLGIDSQSKNRYAVGAACGVIFFLFYGCWIYLAPSSSLSELEPIIVLIVLGLSLWVISIVYELNSGFSIFQRYTLVFLVISISGLPLYMIKSIVEGRFTVDYPASMLPLLQFTLMLVALVVLANIYEARVYDRKERKSIISAQRMEDECELKFEDIDDFMAEKGIYESFGVQDFPKGTELGEAELNYCVSDLSDD
ncbi:MAG: hypothetical protein JSV56_08725 [Methanomassiliicoccales archaeon]|nr:MAG: hypothetical protein JSV56_08725 [Methanomassiliicoccales archaeon]